MNNLFWINKYNPLKFEDLISEHSPSLKKYFEIPKSVPSLIFYSISPGTGKSTTVNIIKENSDIDFLKIDASFDNGVDIIRERVMSFSKSLSMNPNSKRCVFFEEASRLTPSAQDALKDLMDETRDHTFFIFNCNDISKIVDPIKSRCILLNFGSPNKDLIIKRLKTIIKNENIKINEEELKSLVNIKYPDIRSMINTLQEYHMEQKSFSNFMDNNYSDALKAVNESNVFYFVEKVMGGSSDFDMHGFVPFFMNKIFKNSDKIPLDKLSAIGLLLADIEKNWEINAHKEIIFLANITEIIRVLHR
jgi:replication factor C small subunit